MNSPSGFIFWIWLCGTTRTFKTHKAPVFTDNGWSIYPDSGQVLFTAGNILVFLVPGK